MPATPRPRLTQSKIDATQVADGELTRRMSPADAARGTPLPAHMVNPPRQQRTPQLDQVAVKGDAAMGVPSQQLMNEMLKNQAPQAGAVGIYAPGAPLQVVPGIESPYGPRIWDFPYGYNIAALPRSTEGTSFQELRDLSDLYYGIRLCQRVWFDVINRLELKISFEPGVIPDGESETDAKWKKLTQPARDFLAYPDGQNSLSDWLIMSVSDVQELGQSIIFKNRNKMGEIIALDVIDAALVKPLLDQRGRLPKPPYPAFEQFIKGIPAGLYAGDTDVTQQWTSSQMHLIREMARTNSVYSRSRVEDILLIINQALRKQNLDLTRYTDGSTPEGMVFVDDQAGSLSGPEVEEIERNINGVLAGNDRMRARLKVMPPGLKDYTNTRSPDPQIDFDMWLLKITCGSFGVTMAEIGITDDVNRSTGDSQENVIYRRVVQPLVVRYAAFLTEVVKERFDKRMQVEWGGIEEREDELQKAQMLQIGVQAGAISPSTMAKQMGWPVDKEIPPFVMFNGGPAAVVVLDDMDALRKQQLQSFQTQTQQAQAGLKNTQLQAEQLQMVIKQQQQQGSQQQGEDQQGQDEGQGQGNEPEPNGPGGGGGNEQQDEQGSEGEPPEDAGASGSNEDQDQGASEQPAEGDGEESGPDDEAAREVDRLIAQAKQRQGKGKQQRMQAADEDVPAEWRRYRDVALRAVKRQQSVPAFTSDVLPANRHAYAADALSRATTPDEVRAVFAEVRETESHPNECRCLVCGCGRPRDDHSEDLPILQPDAPVSAAPHADVKQTQLALTECPVCNKDADSVTETGYWYTGMVCPQCGHEFTMADERTTVVDELRALRADVQRAIEGEVMRPFVQVATPEASRGYANQITEYGTGHRIIGNLGVGGGGKLPMSGVTHVGHHEAGMANGGAKGLERQPLSAQYPAAGFKTGAEVEVWCQQHVPHIQWQIADLAPDVLNHVIPHLLRMGERYPEPFAMLRAVSSADLPKEQMARALHHHDTQTATLELNRQYYRNQFTVEAYARYGIQQDWYVDTPEKADILRTVTHEFGHVVHYWLEGTHVALVPSLAYKGFGQVSDVLNMWLIHNEGHVTPQVSAYATTNHYEAIAEAFTAHVLSAPRAQSTQFVQNFEKLLDRVFHGKRYDTPAPFTTDPVAQAQALQDLQQVWKEIGADA